MNTENIPVIGKVRKTLNSVSVNFSLLAIVCLILAIVIPFYPEVLAFFASALLFVAAIILLNLAYHVNAAKKKYFNWLDR
jgi:zinc transporter ZupT